MALHDGDDGRVEVSWIAVYDGARYCESGYDDDDGFGAYHLVTMRMSERRTRMGSYHVYVSVSSSGFVYQMKVTLGRVHDVLVNENQI